LGLCQKHSFSGFKTARYFWSVAIGQSLWENLRILKKEDFQFVWKKKWTIRTTERSLHEKPPWRY
jgi:hypothetical protein